MKYAITLTILFTGLCIASCERQRDRVVTGFMIYKSSNTPVNSTKFNVQVGEYTDGTFKKTRDEVYPFITAEHNGKFSVMVRSKRTDYIIANPTSGKIYWSGSTGTKQTREVDAGVVYIDSL